MGADNWGVCPSCKRKAEADKIEQQKLVGESYGKVAPDEYLRLFNEAAQPISLKDTLREDYEIGVDETGYFAVSYSGSCHVCKFAFTFKEERDTLKAAR